MSDQMLKNLNLTVLDLLGTVEGLQARPVTVLRTGITLCALSERHSVQAVSTGEESRGLADFERTAAVEAACCNS
jgi:hypothetical protein